MPWLLALQRVLFVVERNEALDDSATQECDRADRSLPAGKAKPADDVGQESLATRR